jgi:hypothetical protein
MTPANPLIDVLGGGSRTAPTRTNHFITPSSGLEAEA